jgi:thiazole synthase
MGCAYMRWDKGAQRRMDDTLSVRVNGSHRRVPKGSTVADLALELGLDPARVAVERNLEIVPRSTLAQIEIEDGDDYEIVTFVGGG